MSSKLQTNKNKRKKEFKKKKLSTNIVSSDSDEENSEHELSYYMDDKIKMMKEVLKILKPKKIKSMAPDCIKNLDMEEINAMLLEELLGISNKRLGYIFNGESADHELSSSESEDEKPLVDVISLDDISDDDDIEIYISQEEKDSVEAGLSKKHKKHKSTKSKSKSSVPSIKSEKSDKSKKKKKKSTSKEGSDERAEIADDKDKLMSVLELLELQARARAIRSQLALEAANKKQEETSVTETQTCIKLEDESEEEDAVIIESPKKDEIVIDSSGSDNEKGDLEAHADEAASNNNCNAKITLSSSNSDINEFKSDQTKSNAHSLNESHIEHGKEDSLCENHNKEKSSSASLETKPRQKVKIIRDWSLTNAGVIIDNRENQDNCQVSDSSLEFTSSNNKYDEPDKEENGNKSNFTLSDFKQEKNKSEGDCRTFSAHQESDTNKSKANIEKNNDDNYSQNECDNDEIIINLDEDEMNEMEG